MHYHNILSAVKHRLNSEIHEEQDYAWITPKNFEDILLTVVHVDESIVFSLTLGEIDHYHDDHFKSRLMAMNYSLAKKFGPKFSYSPSTNCITLMYSIADNTTDYESAADLCYNLLQYSKEIKNQFYNQGYPLKENANGV